MRVFFSALAIAGIIASQAYAEPVPDAMSTAPENRAYPVRVLYKLSRGFVNILGAPVEILANPIKEGWKVQRSGGNLLSTSAGMTVGLFTGVGYTVARVGVGAFDMATFVVPTRPVMMPETPFSVVETLGGYEQPSAFSGTRPEPRRHPDLGL